MNSALPHTLAPPEGSIRAKRTNGVRPTSSSTLCATTNPELFGGLFDARRDDELSVRFRPSVIESG
jgi:hypothetical protein